MSDVIGYLFFGAGCMVVVWNLALWLEPRGFSLIGLIPTASMRFDGAGARGRYAWAKGVPVVGSLLVIGGAFVLGMEWARAVQSVVLVLFDPRGLVWEFVRAGGRPASSESRGDGDADHA